MISEFPIYQLGGGIRNNIASQLIDPSEAWDALNEDSSKLLGSSSKRNGYIKETSSVLDGPVRGIWEGKLDTKKRIVVAGSKIYEFTPPATFSEIYSDFPGSATDFVSIAPFRDGSLGRIAVITDGVNRPLYWDGVGGLKELPDNAPYGKFGLTHKTYYVMGNLKTPSTVVYDSGDLVMGACPVASHSAIIELPVGCNQGEIVGVIVEDGSAGNINVEIHSEAVRSWLISHGMTDLRTQKVFREVGITSGSWRNVNVGARFYTSDQKLRVYIYNADSSDNDDVILRILYRKSFDHKPSDIKWCDGSNINEWTIDTTTLAGRLTLDTVGGGDIIKMLPLNNDVFMIYKSDGSIIAAYTTGADNPVFDFTLVSEAFELVSGEAIVSLGGYHWALSTEGMLQIDGKSVQRVKDYDKAKNLFSVRSENWSNTYGVALARKNQVYMSYPRTGGTTNDGVMLYNIQNNIYDNWDCGFNVLGVCTIDATLTISSFTGFLVSDFAGYNIGDTLLNWSAPDVYAGDTSGNVYRLGWKFSDDGSAVDSWRESGWLVPDVRIGGKYWFRYISFEVDLTGGTLIVEYKSDYEGGWRSMPSIDLSSDSGGRTTKIVRRFVNSVARAVKVRWRNATVDESYTVRSVYLGLEPEGGR